MCRVWWHHLWKLVSRYPIFGGCFVFPAKKCCSCFHLLSASNGSRTFDMFSGVSFGPSLIHCQSNESVSMNANPLRVRTWCCWCGFGKTALQQAGRSTDDSYIVVTVMTTCRDCRNSHIIHRNEDDNTLQKSHKLKENTEVVCVFALLAYFLTTYTSFLKLTSFLELVHFLQAIT